MKEIGGFLDIELRGEKSWHPKALKLNSCRNALRFLVVEKKITIVYIPFYTCDAVYDALKKEKICVRFYRIGRDMLPIDLPEILEDNAFVLYTNYWGICEKQVEIMILRYGSQLVVDAAQAFYYKPPENIYAVYSPRKFFGVSDGGYLYSDLDVKKLPLDKSSTRFSHLLKRFEFSANETYSLYKKAEKIVNNLDVMQMSYLTNGLLSTAVDYDEVKVKRRRNFEYLHSHLFNKNGLQLDDFYTAKSVPLVYPFLIDNYGLREYLIKNKIYVATYWENVLEWCNKKDYEYRLTINIIPLPIDQRYNESDMEQLVKLIKE